MINELGRLRRRDGARSWSVCQDIDETTLWVERFESPTWMDHLRWQTRPTESDQAIRGRVAQLTVGESSSVRRLVARPPGAEPLGASTTSAEEAATTGALGPSVERDLHGGLTS